MSKDKLTEGSLPGHLGNLTADEQRKLQETWTRLLKLMDTTSNGTANGHTNGTAHGTHNGTANGDSHKSQAADYRQLLWNMTLADHPDVTVLRFLRARKWDVEKATAMLTSALNWRHEHQIDEQIVRSGDSIALQEQTGSLSADDKGFMAQYRSGKAYVRGSDREDRPVFIIKVRLHNPKLQSPESMERFVLHNIETIRTMIRHPNEKACLIFDLTGFGLKNMDFHVVKFLVQVFEARYPEYLGVVLVHKAPFVFWGVWKMIQPWLDPVIASKINFTSSNSDMAKYITQENLQKSYGGQDSWEYNYIAPVAGEGVAGEGVTEAEKRGEIQAERDELMRKFEDLSAEWAKLDPESADGRQKLADRADVAKQLGENFWKIDPYLRARTYYHRAGVIGSAGEIDYKAAK